MDRDWIAAVGKIMGEAIGVIAVVVIVVAIVGYLNKWVTPLIYSNALFIAGSLVIIAGASSRVAAGADWGLHQRFHAETFQGQSIGEQIGSIVSASSPWRLVILGFISGIALMLISVFVSKIG